MRAVVVDEVQGQPRVMDLPKPSPKPDQLLVRVIAAGLNPVDWKQADRAIKGAAPKVSPFVLGVDASGIVEELGQGVTRFSVGDRVFGQFTHMPLGEGTDAEYAVVPELGAVAILPDGVEFEVGAALPTAGMTALSLIESMNLPKGATLLIVGATGGVGSFATQIAADKGLRVVGTASDSESDRMRGLGAATTVDHTQGDVGKQVKQLFPAGVDGLIDLVSDASKLGSLTDVVRQGGYVYSTIGAANDQSLRAKGLLGGNFVLKATPQLLERLGDEVAKKSLEVPIEAVIELEDVPVAMARSRAGHSHGKTVIRIGRPETE